MEYVTELVDGNGVSTGEQIKIPANTSVKQLNEILNDYLKNEEPTPYSFYVDDEMVVGGLDKLQTKPSTEKVLQIVYKPESAFGIRPVSYCSASLKGHSHIVLCIAFSPDGTELATGGGDGTVIFWDVSTQTLKQRVPISEPGEKKPAWIQCIQWYSDSKTVALAGTDGFVTVIKKQDDGEMKISKRFRVSLSPIFALEWEPMHLHNSTFPRLAISTKKGEVLIFCSQTGTRLVSTSGHTNSVMGLGWNGKGVIFSASHDKTVKAWDSNTGAQLDSWSCRSGAWRTLAISSQTILRNGGYELGKLVDPDPKVAALKRYEAFLHNTPHEMVAVGGEDFTITLLSFENNKFTQISRMTGHTKQVNHIVFSPNGYWLASASDDRSVKLFDGKTGKFICTLGKGRNKNTGMHINSVYRLAWSADSRLLISASADTTLKLWDIRQQKLLRDLPGHADVVYAVDWAQAGAKAASGGKDMVVKLWCA